LIVTKLHVMVEYVQIRHQYVLLGNIAIKTSSLLLCDLDYKLLVYGEVSDRNVQCFSLTT